MMDYGFLTYGIKQKTDTKLQSFDIKEHIMLIDFPDFHMHRENRHNIHGVNDFSDKNSKSYLEKINISTIPIALRKQMLHELYNDCTLKQAIFFIEQNLSIIEDLGILSEKWSIYIELYVWFLSKFIQENFLIHEWNRIHALLSKVRITQTALRLNNDNKDLTLKQMDFDMLNQENIRNKQILNEIKSLVLEFDVNLEESLPLVLKELNAIYENQYTFTVNQSKKIVYFHASPNKLLEMYALLSPKFNVSIRIDHIIYDQSQGTRNESAIVNQSTLWAYIWCSLDFSSQSSQDNNELVVEIIKFIDDTKIPVQFIL